MKLDNHHIVSFKVISIVRFPNIDINTIVFTLQLTKDFSRCTKCKLIFTKKLSIRMYVTETLSSSENEHIYFDGFVSFSSIPS